RKMSEIKPHIKVWWREGSQSQQLIRDGEVDMMAMWSARAVDLIDDKVPLEIVWNGAEIYYANLLVPKGDPNAKAAWQFCNFVAQAKSQANFAMLLPYGPANPNARALMSEARLRQTPAWPENEKVAFKHDAAWIAPRLAQLRERWTQWLTTCDGRTDDRPDVSECTRAWVMAIGLQSREAHMRTQFKIALGISAPCCSRSSMARLPRRRSQLLPELRDKCICFRQPWRPRNWAGTTTRRS